MSTHNPEEPCDRCHVNPATAMLGTSEFVEVVCDKCYDAQKRIARNVYRDYCDWCCDDRDGVKDDVKAWDEQMVYSLCPACRAENHPPADWDDDIDDDIDDAPVIERDEDEAHGTDLDNAASSYDERHDDDEYWDDARADYAERLQDSLFDIAATEFELARFAQDCAHSDRGPDAEDALAIVLTISCRRDIDPARVFA
jgi:hypothetical protein